MVAVLVWLVVMAFLISIASFIYFRNRFSPLPQPSDPTTDPDAPTGATDLAPVGMQVGYLQHLFSSAGDAGPGAGLTRPEGIALQQGRQRRRRGEDSATADDGDGRSGAQVREDLPKYEEPPAYIHVSEPPELSHPISLLGVATVGTRPGVEWAEVPRTDTSATTTIPTRTQGHVQGQAVR